MTDHRCGWPQDPCANCEAISEAQRRLRPLKVVNRTRQDYRRTARWWELEARRGYASSKRSLLYAQNMRWAAELAGIYGDGTWPELLARADVKAPDIDKMLEEQEPPKPKDTDPGVADLPEGWRSLNFAQRRDLMRGARLPGPESIIGERATEGS